MVSYSGSKTIIPEDFIDFVYGSSSPQWCHNPVHERRAEQHSKIPPFVQSSDNYIVVSTFCIHFECTLVYELTYLQFTSIYSIFKRRTMNPISCRLDLYIQSFAASPSSTTLILHSPTCGICKIGWK